jgi:tetratricopeptide (TPR) repeat protein
MPDLPKSVIKFGVELAKHQAKTHLGEGVLNVLAGQVAEVGGQASAEKVASFFEHGANAEKLLQAFEQADTCFAEQCGDDTLRQAIQAQPLAALPSLEKLAAALPTSLDDLGLLSALRRRFSEAWPGQLSEDQLDHAASVYRTCLDRALAAKCAQLLPTIFRKIERIEAVANRLLAEQHEIKAALLDVVDLGRIELSRQWLRPAPPRPSSRLVGRTRELDALRQLLTPDRGAPISVAVYGAPGVGKTLLAEHLAVRLDDVFPGGVLFNRFGVGFRNPQLAAPIINRWASHAFGGRPLPEGVQLTNDAVRALLTGHGSLLVVLDDLWDLKILARLRDALPPNASMLITTRRERLASETGGEVYALDLLSDEDAVELLRKRVRRSTEVDVPLLVALTGTLGRHAQALDIAGGGLDRLPRAQWPDAVESIARHLRAGTGFGEPRLPGDGEPRLPGDEEAPSPVEASLQFSYDDIDDLGQKRFRALGAFAPDASFRTGAAALVWDCPPDEAQAQLSAFAEHSLLTRLEDEQGTVRWQQHTLIRTFALMLLLRADEEQMRREQHATIHFAAIREEDSRQTSYRLLPDYPQLGHAFAWAVEHDLELAQELAARTADLQEAFGLVRDSYDWAVRLNGAVGGSDDRSAKARALGTVANALSRLASLPVVDRRKLLTEALCTYDELLDYFQPTVAPWEYAIVQNNRGNFLIQLASLPVEDHRGRMAQALDALDEALRYRSPDIDAGTYATTQSNRAHVLSQMAAAAHNIVESHELLQQSLSAVNEALNHLTTERVPLDYAKAQNVRGNVLSRLAALPDEDRPVRLTQALSAYEAALRYRPAGVAPVSYAVTLYNWANVLSQLGEFVDGNQQALLLRALNAYDEALTYLHPSVVPLDHASALNNRATVLIDLARIPGENVHARLLEALRCGTQALVWFTHTEHLIHAQTAATTLKTIRREAGDTFSSLWTELGVGEPPGWLMSPESPDDSPT